MNIFRAHSKAVIIGVLLLAIILLAGAFYIRESGKIATADADTKVLQTQASTNNIPLTATTVAATATSPNPMVTVSVDGKTTTVNIAKGKVFDALKLASVDLTEGDMVYPIKGADIKDLRAGTTITVTRVDRETLTEEVTVPFKTEYVEDGNMYEGEEEITQYGVDGKEVRTYKVTYHDGRVISNRLIATEEIEDAQTQIIHVGVKTTEPEESETLQEEMKVEPEIPQEIQEPEAEPVEEPEATNPDPQQEEERKQEEPQEEASQTEEPTEEPVEEPVEESTEEPAESTVYFENSYQEFAYSMFPNYGWTDDDFNALVNLWNRESGWNPNAHNSYSGAHGIPQALPGNKMAAFGDDWETNGNTQVLWGLDYIAGRYGTPSAAWNSFCSQGWY